MDEVGGLCARHGTGRSRRRAQLSRGRSYRAYFIEWPARPEARNIYNHNLVAAARYLRAAPKGEQVGISALYPLYYHDPWIQRYVTRRDDLQMRWFDGRGGIVYPGQGAARYVFSALTPLDPALRAEFDAGAVLQERVTLDLSDQNPYFEVWQWDGQEALTARLDVLIASSPTWLSPEVQFTQPELRQALDGPAQFGDLMSLLAYRLNATVFAPGGTVELVTYWRAQRAAIAQDDWRTFVHLLDGQSRELGGVDVLHCPPTGWLPGDVIIQVHRFRVSEGATPGEAYLEVGVYRHTTGRLPVVTTQAVADRVLLAPVQVR